MITLDELSIIIKNLNDKLLGINNELLIAVEKYQIKYERMLNRIDFDTEDGFLKQTVSNYNIAQSINPVGDLNFDGVVSNQIANYDKVPIYQKAFNLKIGMDINFNYSDARILKIAKNMDFDNLVTQGKNIDQLIKKELVNAIALGSSLKNTINNLSESLLGGGDVMGKLARYSTTYMRTSLFGLSRIIDQEAYDSLDIKEFIYVGVIFDSKIRPFCAQHVGKVYNKKQIEKFSEQNKSGLNPYFAPGGYNCRHRLIPAEVI
jgi:hypothetical protein